MKTKILKKRILSVFLALLIALSAMIPGISALAGEVSGDGGDSGVIGFYDIEIFYEDGTLVPTYQEDGETDYIEYMMEGDKKQFKYQFIDCTLPDNGYVKWTSDTPTVCDVTEDGIVRAFDSSKGAAVRLWLDNEVGSIPLVGGIIKAALEKVLFNDTINVDTMDTDAIIALVEGAFGSDSILGKYVDSYKGELIDSLRGYLDKVNTVISCTMYDSEGKVLDTDSFSVCVQKSDAPYADFIPNGTHITNKQDIPTTVAVGSTVQLSACTTPTRLHMGVIYSVKNTSIFTDGKVIATVDDSGLVTFKNTGTVTIVVSPDTDGFIQNLLKYINYIYELGDTSSIDSSQIADILIKYVGLDINRNVLAALLDACFAIYDIVGDTADPVQLTATAARILGNLILQFTTNDTITFTVVDGVPCTDFDIEGANTVREGTQIQLSIENAQPVAADTSDITWSSSDPSIAYVDPVTGTITGRDAGGSLGQYSQQTVEITATSAANNVSKTVTITVTGKTGSYLSDVEITSDKEKINIGEDQYLHANVYPSRVADSNNLYIRWGVEIINSETGEPEQLWAVEPYQETDAEGNPLVDSEGNPVMNDGSVTDGIGTIDYQGHYYATSGGTCKIICKAQTGYNLSDDNFFEISSVTTSKNIDNGQPVESISLSAIDVTSGGTMTAKDVVIGDKTYHYVTVKKTVMDGLYGNGCVVKANILPENATNKNVKWYIDNNDYELDNQDNAAGTVEVKMKSGVEKATSVNVYCISEDGKIKSDVITIAVSRNYATSNVIDGGDISLKNGYTANVTHTITPNNSAFASDAYTCYECNWYSNDESILTVESVDSDGNAVIKGVDVGTTTLYCVSADGAIVDTVNVTVYPDKDRLVEILGLCEKTVITKTTENAEDYKEYMRVLNYAYYILDEMPLAAQDTVNTYADNLLYVFYKLGGYVGLNSISILDSSSKEAKDHLSVKVDTLIYTNTSYKLSYQLNPEGAMYSSVKWSSDDNSSVSVDSTGLCKPTSNDACSATITVTATDYFGNSVSDSVVIAFAKTTVTGVTLDPAEIVGGKAGETRNIKANVEPLNIFGNSSADISGVIWKSSDESVATVDQNGTVTFVYGGDCIITATTVDGGFKAECKVNVVTNYDKLQELINTYKGLSLSPENYYPDTYQAYTQKLAEAEAMIAANASTQDEADAMYAELEEAYNGLKKYTFIQKVELYKDGEATADYYQYDLSLLSEGLSYKNAELNLNVRLYPNNASYNTVEWTSSTDLISVSESGLAKPTKDQSCYGMITCTVTDHFGNQWSDDVWVSFAYYPVTGVTLNQTEIAGEIGAQYQLNCTIYPTGDSVFHIGAASIKDVLWVSDNENVATVDQSGLVTFVGAGATTVRAVSYDGGFEGVCAVSTSGDRSALNQAIEKYKNVNYMDYEYEYGMAFKSAFEAAQAALENNSLTQSEINAAANNLNAAGEALAGHEFTVASTLNFTYDNQKQNALFDYKSEGSGAVDDNAATHSFVGSSRLYKSRVVLNASVPADAASNYPSVTWSVADKSDNADVSINGTSVSVNPSTAGNSAKATLVATATDSYGRTVSRTIRVVVADELVNGITLDQTSIERYANAGAFKINATVNPSDAGIKDVIWISSDESIATVASDGTVTPHNTGSVVITAQTYDGNYTATCSVKLNTDYTVLANVYAQYNEFYQQTKDTHTYTNASLAVLEQALTLANNIINQSTANQADVDKTIEQLHNAYNNLVFFVPVEGVNISLVETENASVVNEGFIRYEAASLNGVSLQLSASVLPETCEGVTIEWSVEGGSGITVDSTGLVSKSGLSGEYAVVTATATDEVGNTAKGSVYVSFVRVPVHSVSFDEELVHGAPSTTVTLEPKVSGSTAISIPSIRDCIFTSSNPDIATVDANGTVTFITGGECTITATSIDGGISASIRAITTNDNTALAAAIEQYSSVDYMAYEYEYGMAFKTAYDNAKVVCDDYMSTQQAIDAALVELQTCYNDLAAHPFIYPGELQITCNSEAVQDGASLVKDESNQVVLNASYATGAMVKSSELTFANAVGVTAEVLGNMIIITKDNTDEYGSIDVTFTVTDDYDRVTTVTKSIKIVDDVKMIESFKFVYEGAEVDRVDYKNINLYGKTISLSINTYPVAAEPYTNIEWSSSNSKLTVDQNGNVKIDGLVTASNYSATITCKLTLSDGTVITNSIPVTFTVGR